MWDSIQEKQKAFEEEAVTHMDALYNSALKLTYNEDDAKDLIQESYFKAFRFFEQFEPGTSCKAWLFKILKNTFINKYRKKVKQPEQVDFNAVESFVDLIKDKNYDEDEALDDGIVNSYLSDEINEALTKLSYEFKMVLILSDVEGFSYKEIADIMDCPIGTIRSRLSRARKMMFKNLLKYAKKEGYYQEEEEDQ
ncbi:sigma-70 family RNA polymerase sigma factor [candidate division KSB1 bacterium]|nr:sigma-70 family RNA polymerase sigma factor [candidate division KSB1 bacterium]